MARIAPTTLRSSGRGLIWLVAFLVALSVALTTTPRAEAVSVCPYACAWPAGARADVPLKAIRGVLLVRRATLPTQQAKKNLDSAIESLDWALAPAGWTSNGQVVASDAGSLVFANLRLTVLRLYFRGSALRQATEFERSGIVATMWYIAIGRFNRVWAAGGDESALWKAENQLHAGDRDFTVNRVRATLKYWRAWKHLAGQPG